MTRATVARPATHCAATKAVTVLLTARVTVALMEEEEKSVKRTAVLAGERTVLLMADVPQVNLRGCMKCIMCIFFYF